MTVSIAIQLIGYLLGAVSAFFAYKKSAQAKDSTKSMKNAIAGFQAMVAMLELFPSSNPTIQKAKEIARTILSQVVLNEDELVRASEQIKELLANAGFASESNQTDPSQVDQAAQLLKIMREGENKRPQDATDKTSPLRAITFVLFFCLCSCTIGCTPAITRYTQETFIPGAGTGQRDAVILRAPDGVRAQDIIVKDVTSTVGKTNANIGFFLPAIEVTSDTLHIIPAQ